MENNSYDLLLSHSIILCLSLLSSGQCGACWAFSAIGALEAAHFLKYGELVALSEQELLDCDIKDHGCFGGLMDIAFEFDESGRGVCKEDDYPYLADKNDSCLKECEPVDGTLVKSFVDVPEGNYHALKRAIVLDPQRSRRFVTAR